MTAIPFDQVFSFSAEQLKASYLVSLRHLNKSFKKLDEKAPESEAEAEAEESANESDHDKMTDIEPAVTTTDDNTKPKKKPSKKRREIEYDLDDPFIDDSEMNEVYRSVFDLMGEGGGLSEVEEEARSGAEEAEEAALGSVKQPSFFVYRGPLSNEILAKEFDIVESEDDEPQSEDSSQLSSNTKPRARSTNKKSSSAKKVQKPVKPAKKAKEPKPPKPAKEPKPPKEPKAKKAKPEKPPKPEKATDLLQDAARRFGEDLFSAEDGDGAASRSESVAAKAAAQAAPKLSAAQLGDVSLMELRECLFAFKAAATATPFSPGKFPTALRSHLDDCLCAALRAFKPSANEPLPAALCPALASFLPFSVSALAKLLQKKILKSLKESIENKKLTERYEKWPTLVIQRLSEENSIVGPEDASPEKKSRLKFTDEMRQLLFDVIRLEIDANNLAATCNLLSLNESATDDSTASSAFKVQTEMNLRKSVYAKLASIPGLPLGLVSTADLSREFGAQKRKHDKKVAKVAAECFFGEEAIELLLKPKVVVTTGAGANGNDNENAVDLTALDALPPLMPPVNPLANLFNDAMEE